MRLFLILITLSMSLQLRAQPEELKGLDYDQLANHYINSLKNGVLYVRLQTKSRKIAILKRAGNITAAKKVEEDQARENKSIIEAFRKTFTFCPVHFFYSHDSKYILSSNLDSIKFLNDNLEHDKTVIASPNFLIAEIAIIQNDTSQHFAGRTGNYEKDSTGSLNEQKQYSGGTSLTFGALLIKSPQLVQLSPPFPFYVRTLATLPIVRRSHEKVVTIMNENLTSFYEYTNGLGPDSRKWFEK